MRARATAIQCDFATGIVTVAPGVYHIGGMSIVAYDSGGEPPEMTTIRAPASAGYCRLRTLGSSPILDPGMRDIANDDASVLCVGSPASANLTPSLFEAYFETDRPARLVLEHQSGSKPEQIYLRVFTQNSKWHAMARMAVRRVHGWGPAKRRRHAGAAGARQGARGKGRHPCRINNRSSDL